MDRITRGLVSDFKSSNALDEAIGEDAVFEHFVNYIVMATKHTLEFDLLSMHTGGGSDLGIDGFAIMVNGAIIDATEDIDELIDANGFLDAHFVFVQAKRSATFSSGDIRTFIDGVKDVFLEEPRFPRNEKIDARCELVNAIFAKSAKFTRGNPLCSIYYVTTGSWQEDQHLRSVINSGVKDIKGLELLRDVIFTPMGAREVQNLYRKTQNKNAQTINFEHKTTMPVDVNGVEEAYYGLIGARDLIDMVSDEDGDLNRSLFYDNIRDFRGESDVNISIAETIRAGNANRFPIYNNGITVVAESLQKTGNRYTLEDFQIVNGCQTSNVLYNERDSVGEDVYVPLRLIIANDPEVRNEVIKATNNQNAVKREEIISLTDFQKHLEAFYESITDTSKRLYYERRTNQFTGTDVDKVRIVNIPAQIRTFSSCFLGLPHLSGRYYGTLQRETEERIFLEGHPPEAYYASSFINYRIECGFRRGAYESKYRPFRYHMIGLARIALIGNEMPSFISNAFRRKCERLISLIHSDAILESAISESIRVINDKVVNFNRDTAKQVGLMATLASECQQVAEPDAESAG